MPPEAGMQETARLLLATQLPSMLRTLGKLSAHASLFVFRLELLSNSEDFDRVSADFIRFLRIPRDHPRMLDEEEEHGLGRAGSANELWVRAMAAMQQHDTHRWASETLQKHEHVNLARLLPKGNGGVARLARALRTNETTCAALASFTYALGYAGSLDYALATRCGIEPRAGSAKRK